MPSAPVIISGVRPSSLVPLEPSVSEVHVGMDFGCGESFSQGTCEGDSAAEEALSEAARRMLEVCSDACSRWFSAMRSCIRRDRVRQCLFREEHGLPNSAKIPYQRQPVTAAEQSVAEMSEYTIRCLFGDSVADYAREKFEHAIDTGDMRAFKIRLIVIKARDCLHKEKSPLLPWFVKGTEMCIDKAEKLAGCIPDPSPRRKSKAEQEEKRKREEEQKRMNEMQPELPLVWPGHGKKPYANQDIDGSDSCLSTDDVISDDPIGSVCELKTVACKKDGKDGAVSERTQDSDNVTVTVTVTNGHAGSGRKSPKRRKQKKANSGVVRKAREYNTVDQILDDIEDGKIVPYESLDEICADLKAGLLTPVEALMFTNALDRYSPEGSECVDDENRLDLERETVGVGEDDDDDEATGANLAAMRGGGGDAQLLALLKELRKDMAHKLNLQPWIIFGDPSLDDMSIIYPITLDELRNCQGVGEGKAKKFGKEFVKLIAKYVEENEIIRPDDFVVKTTASKSDKKVKIISQIDRRLPFEDIALSVDLSMDELMDEVETIVSSGTKLNLNYYINQEVDMDVIEELMDYFRYDAASDSVEDALNELGNDYSDQEIRLVRLKFLCEVAS